ncbi:MAG: hypothetical protein WAR21_02160 [Candidatus Acidiferrales bacterium]
MANRAFVSIWTKGFAEATMLGQFERLLETVRFSAERPGFTELVIRVVDPAETSLVERDLRSHPLDAAALMDLAREHTHADSAYEVWAHWDLWVYDAASRRWQLRPQPLGIICHGEEYDGGAYAEAGHFQADIGFEHLFTGHAGLLGARATSATPPLHPVEAEFLAVMARPDNLRGYHQRTRENIEKLLEWMRAVEEALPVERYRLWSEGEENFEARLDEILAVR